MDQALTIFGAGSWGTALAIRLASAGRSVTLWARREEAAETLRTTRHNATYLPDMVLPDAVRVTSDLQEAAEASTFWVLAVPSQSMRHVAERVQPFVTPRHTVVSVAKGIENGTLMTMSQVLAETLTPLPYERIGVLYGPSHAEEVADARPTTVVAAAEHPDVALQIQRMFMTDRLRVYINTDVIGVEIAGSVKNVMAIAAGIGDGLGYGDNSKAAIVTRGIAELRRLGMVMGADASTFAGLAGIGDLVVTCFSRHSRNRHLGEQIGKGMTLDEIEAGMSMVAEGVRTTESVHDLARQHQIEMPITEAVYSILFENKQPEVAVEELMSRSAKRENWLPDVLQE